MAITRRFFVFAAGILSALLPGSRRGHAQQAGGEVAFESGVASGDPTSRAVVLWTRAVPEQAAGAIEVEWDVATDEGFAQVVATGRGRTSSARDWTVKVDCSGLAADRWYWYRFRAGGATSPTGRTRTLPEGRVDQVRLAVVSCSNYSFGYFNAYRSIAERDDIDLVLHLGDYIYEHGPRGYGGEVAERLGRRPEPAHEILDLTDYRTRYRQYRSDPDLQALHASLPTIAVWDDHEIANNTWHSGAQNHTEGDGEGGEGDFFERKAAAVKAFHEWMPIRSRAGAAGDKIYRSVRIGDLASLIMLDTRLVGRDQQLDYAVQLDAPTAEAAERFRAELIDDPARTMLGAEQEAWLKMELASSKAAGIPWQVLGQQLLVGGLRTPDLRDLIGGVDDARLRRLVAQAEYGLPLNLDAWDGYGAARERLAQDVLSFGDNVVVLAGDTHNSWAFDLLDRSGRQFGVEFGTTSVTSPGIERLLPLPPEAFARKLREANDHLRYTEVSQRGYMTLLLQRDRVEAQWVYVDTVESRQFVATPAAVARARVHEGPGLEPLEIDRG